MSVSNLNWRKLLCGFLLLTFCIPTWAHQKIINIYGWPGVIPDSVFREFEKSTGIKVNFSTYDNNEVMYAKLRASKNPGYDLIQPSSYYVDRMRRQQMLTQLNKKRLIHFKYLNPEFLNHSYDPNNQYSVPFYWGITGIFVNKAYYTPSHLQQWTDLWDQRYQNQLVMLDDSREVFSMALLALGYNPNDSDPDHIKAAYLKLKTLMPNVKIFNSEAVISVLIDEDATIGMAWNGDLVKAAAENSNLRFIFPKEGFVVWVDSFAIPAHAPHLENAYRFLNFIMQPDIAAKIALYNNYSTTNLAALRLLPKPIRDNTIAYPDHQTMRHGYFQTDINDNALALYEHYWQLLKMGG